ncbi:ATP-binding cassette domain-containing protein [Listeria monocytogenes]|uniref:ATP-binding cassette domain-containing protein n=1 Tax=Listeria monocytogenes TaxID=1639 RepID=UPI000854F784|nr:ABC transporter ATP-binding protein [Listeria monocytogenes]EBF5120633.1 ABC transporter ATP-binding protein [Listeria monocytogenes]EKK8150013.1 ABC transporter ATP-binding protein [Listeria monocytogenes]EKK9549951.1 ABC transporter ATP-binding protein [Listeria monocytogenes]OER24400.1 ABC transporter ATP-binding protein [Listeria monocytogenes]RKA91187.1 ABC transporter ATP-binding protein YtrB [Listeria monocytogenes]
MLVGNNIAKSYPNKLVLQNVDFEAKPGDMIVLTGENGSGKTTLLDMLANLKKPDSGTLELDNEVFTTNDIRQQIAYLNNELYAKKSTTIEEFMKQHALLFENMELDKWDRLLAGWRINKRLKLGELSTGMLMKVKIGSVLARKTKLYLYDEPFASIDIMARSEVMKAIISETEPDAITIISSHHLEGTEKLYNKLWLIKGNTLKTIETETYREATGNSLIDFYKEEMNK